MRSTLFVIGSIIAAVTWILWALLASPHLVPSFPSEIKGISFSPMRVGNNPNKDRWPTSEEIKADLELLSGQVKSIRTYSVRGALGDIPGIARHFDFDITLGAWITDDAEANEKEIQEVIRLANASPNVARVIVGNETLLRKQIPTWQLIEYVDRVRKAVRIPVSTAEPWHVWLVEPELADHVDFIAVQLLPWWEGIPLNGAVDFVFARHQDIQRIFPGKHVVISEVGWPSNGLTRLAMSKSGDTEAAVIDAALAGAKGAAAPSRKPSFLQCLLNPATPSVSNQATFVRSFLHRAEQEGLDYYLLEAFDQPWKSNFEGAIGAYWGIYDAERNPKFPFTGSVSQISGWPFLAAFSALLALALFALLMLDSKKLGLHGRVFLAVVALCTASVALWIVYSYTGLYLTVLTTVVGIILAVGLVIAALLTLVESHEMAEAAWLTHKRANARPQAVELKEWPKVSIHVPAYQEPPAMMINTLNALTRLDYPNYEVLVIDNNTKDPSLWKPVEAECTRLGGPFRFFHVDPLRGFKAGALNFALAHTAADAEIVAVIDSDYQVDPAWLKELVPLFQEQDVACVQAPQDYVPENDNLFKSMCYAEYQGFFHIGMVTRNERNAIIQHGTMTMVRRSVLEEVGRWAEWCITEDAELGLRILEQGYRAVYVNRSYGRGLLPDRFIDYKKQRHRWAYGSIQIMKRHARQLFGLEPTKLTVGQRYHFLGGWLPWLADGANLIWTIVAVLWSLAIVVAPVHFGPPPAIMILPIAAIFFFKVVKTLYLYVFKIGFPLKDTLGSVIAGTSLSHVVAKAVLSGFVTSGKPFFRTPKCKNRPHIFDAFAAASDEVVLMLVLWAAAAAVIFVHGRYFPAALVWSALLVVQSLPYLAALVAALINSARVARQAAGQEPVAALQPQP
ncbi:MAG: glycosyltransferase [Thermodesulfobacteriota bacterium]